MLPPPADDGDDSDGDLVTDYLNANNNSSSNGPTGIHTVEGSAAAGGVGQVTARQQAFMLQQQQSQDLSTGTTATTATTSNTTTPRSSRGSIHLYSNGGSGKGGGGTGFGGGAGQNGGNNSYNMVPIISVTPHSPGTKFSGILGEKHTFLDR